MNSVLVLGGSGFVGRSVCERLVRHAVAAHTVVPTRRLRNAAALRPLPGIDLVEIDVLADVHDDRTLARLVAGSDAVVNLVAILHGSEAAFQKVHVDLPQRLVHAAKAAGGRRIVHVSALGVGGTPPSDYLRSKTAGEAVLQASGLPLTVLRPSVLFGARDRFLNLFAELLAVAPVMPLACADARFQPAWVEDVAEAIVRCLQRPDTIGRVYECAGPEVMTLRQLVQCAGRWSGHPRPVIPLPRWMGGLQAGALELLPGEPLMSRDNLASMQVPNVATGQLPGFAALDIAPTAVGQVAPLYLGRSGPSKLDRFRANGRRG